MSLALEIKIFKCLLSTLYIPGTVPGAENAPANHRLLPLCFCVSNGDSPRTIKPAFQTAFSAVQMRNNKVTSEVTLGRERTTWKCDWVGGELTRDDQCKSTPFNKALK